jgi:hypothetical protein
MPSLFMVCIKHICIITLPFLYRFESRKMFPHAEILSRAPLLHFHYRNFIATTISSASPLLTPELRCWLISEALRIMDLPDFDTNSFLKCLDPYPGSLQNAFIHFFFCNIGLLLLGTGWAARNNKNFGAAVFALC